MLLSQSLWNSLLSKGFISIKADKTSNDSLKNSPGISTAKRRVYLSLPTLGDNQDKDDSTFWNAAQRHNEIAATSGTNQTKCFFFLFHKWLLVLFTRTKKGPSFSINEAGNWVRGPAGYGLTTMAWGPNLTLSLCCGTAWKNFSLKPPPRYLLLPTHPSIPHPKVSCFSADRY